LRTEDLKSVSPKTLSWFIGVWKAFEEIELGF
jgi:hypothetical protein